MIDRKTFRWRTSEGKVVSIGDMATSHMFNAMKMCFNHLAREHGGTPIWHTFRYADYREYARTNPRGLAQTVLFFLSEIQHRGDLPARYEDPYWEIIRQMMPDIPKQNILSETQALLRAND